MTPVSPWQESPGAEIARATTTNHEFANKVRQAFSLPGLLPLAAMRSSRPGVPVALRSRRGGIIASLLFTGMIVFLALLIAGIVVTKNVRIRTTDGANGADVAIDTPGGRLNIRASDHMNPALTGVPIYPGAYRAKDGGANIEWRSKEGDSDKNIYVIGGEFRTRDSAAAVVEYYRGQLPNLMIVSEEDRSTRLEYREGGVKRIISVREEHGETHIGVVSIGGRESN